MKWNFFLKSNKKEGNFLENGCYKAINFYNKKNKIISNYCYGNLGYGQIVITSHTRVINLLGVVWESTMRNLCVINLSLKEGHLLPQKVTLDHRTEIFITPQMNGNSAV